MNVVIEREEPVIQPIKKVVIELDADEAIIVKAVLNYRSRVSALVGDMTGLSRGSIQHVLFGIWKGLHDQGVHANG